MCLSACQFDGFPRNQWWAADEKSGLAARSRGNPVVLPKKYYGNTINITVVVGLSSISIVFSPINAINTIWKNRQLFSSISIYFHSISIVISGISDELSSISIVFPKSQPFRHKMPRHVSRPVWARPAGYGASAVPRRLESVTERGDLKMTIKAMI